MTVEGTPESDCLLRCGRPLDSPRFRLRNRPTRNLPPREISCTGVAHRRCPLESRALLGGCARALPGPFPAEIGHSPCVLGILWPTIG